MPPANAVFWDHVLVDESCGGGKGTALRGLLKKIEALYGQERRTMADGSRDSNRTRRSPYLDRLLGALPDGDSEAPLARTRSRLESQSRTGETRRHPDARRLAAHHRRPLPGPAPPHRAEGRIG